MNVSRLMRPGEPGATGIDRFEAAYARLALNSSDFDTRFVIGGSGGSWRESRAARVSAVLSDDGAERDGDAAPQAEIRAFLLAEPASDHHRSSVQRIRFSARGGPSPAWLRMMESFGAMASWRLPLDTLKNAIHLQASHTLLAAPSALEALSRRRIASVHYFHDTIPLDFPEYCRPGEREAHFSRAAALKRLAARILVSSGAVAGRIAHLFAGMPGASPPVEIVPPGLAAAFSEQRTPERAVRPYFVVVGTIEPRKNHLLLLNIWRRMARSMPPAAVPKLVIVGRRGWENEAMVDYLNRCEALFGHVLEVEGLPDDALADLIAGAAGLLAPSFAEGYGLSLAEAATLGIPVIASDIASHREVWAARGKGRALWLDPVDGPGWLSAIVELAEGYAGPGSAESARNINGLGWESHWAAVEAILRQTLASRA